MADKKTRKAEVAILPQEQSAETLIAQGIEKGISVDTMERLLAMRRELKAERAKEAFDTAMAKFQSECPTIVKTKEVKTRAGVVAYRYAPIESIVQQVKNQLQDNGFSYKTDQEMKETGVKVTVRVIHSGGHSEETSMEVPFGSKTDIMSLSQVTAAATTFAKRHAFLNAFGILTGDEDTDAAPSEEDGTSRMKPYSRPKVAAEDTQTRDPADSPLPEQKKRLARILADKGVDFTDIKWVTQFIADETELVLKDENLPEIIRKLEERNHI